MPLDSRFVRALNLCFAPLIWAFSQRTPFWKSRIRPVSLLLPKLLFLDPDADVPSAASSVSDAAPFGAAPLFLQVPPLLQLLLLMLPASVIAAAAVATPAAVPLLLLLLLLLLLPLSLLLPLLLLLVLSRCFCKCHPCGCCPCPCPCSCCCCCPSLPFAGAAASSVAAATSAGAGGRFLNYSFLSKVQLIENYSRVLDGTHVNLFKSHLKSSLVVCISIRSSSSSSSSSTSPSSIHNRRQ